MMLLWRPRNDLGTRVHSGSQGAKAREREREREGETPAVGCARWRQIRSHLMRKRGREIKMDMVATKLATSGPARPLWSGRVG